LPAAAHSPLWTELYFNKLTSNCKKLLCKEIIQHLISTWVSICSGNSY